MRLRKIKRGGGNEKLEVVGKRGCRGDGKERREKCVCVGKLARKGRRDRGGGRRDKGRVAAHSLGVSLPAKVFLQGVVSRGLGEGPWPRLIPSPHHC